MMRRLSLSQRLALVFTSLLLLCAAAVCVVQLYSSAQYGNAMVQRLSVGLAQQIVAREPLLDARGQVNREALKPLFDRLMVFNPSVELYLISPDGELLADAAPPGHIKRQRVDIVPIQTFLSGGTWPVYGDDPRSEDQRKVFSVAPLNVDGQLRGYLYIILQGETFNELAASAWQKTLGSLLIWTLLLVALFGLLAGGLAWYWVTRRWGCPEKTAWERLNCWRRKRRIRIPAMKWRSCITGLSTWPGRSPGSGIDWPIAIASGVNLSPIFLTICGLH
jgi:hypothetical protein